MSDTKTIPERYAEAAYKACMGIGAFMFTPKALNDTKRDVDVVAEPYAALAAEHAAYVTPQPLDDWHDDDGFALWHKFPIVEPPYCGSPLCDDWPGYHTHWTKIPVPTQPPSTKETNT